MYGINSFASAPFSDTGTPVLPSNNNVIAEYATGSDALSSLGNFQATVSESANATDALASSSVLQASVSESASVSDANVGTDFSVSYLVVGGGCGAGSGYGGGGGAGGVVEVINSVIYNLSTSYTVAVGTGGAGQNYGSVPGSAAQNGNQSQFASVIG